MQHGIRAVLTVLASGALVFSPAKVQAQLEPDSADLRAVLAVLRGGTGSAVWPGYSGPKEFIVCGRNAVTIIALVGAAPRRVAPARSHADSATGASVYVLPGRLSGLEERCFQLRYFWEGRELLSFPALDSLCSIKDPVLATTAALFHEEFHRFQAQDFAPTAVSGSHPLDEPPGVPNHILTSSEFQHRAAEERRLLADALESTSVDSLRAIANRYMAARRARMVLLSEELSAAEDHNERKEASAQLVGYDAALRALGMPAASLAAIVQADLLATPPFDADTLMSSYRHWHIYATGSAIGVVLDRLGVQWRPALQAGRTFPELLAEALSKPRS